MSEEEEDYKNKYLYAIAELENLRKRLNRDILEARDQGKKDALRECCLPIVDDVERAYRAASDPNSSADREAMRIGVQAVANKARHTLSMLNIEAIETVGKPFMASLMEAIAKAPTKGLPAGGVVYEAERGYTIGGQLLRPAKVVVAEDDDAAGG